MNGQVFVGHNWALLVDGLSNNVHNSSEGGWADWHGDGVSGVAHFLASDESLGGVKSNCPNVVASQVLGDLQNQSV